MLKSILCHVSNTKALDLKFIPYGLDRQTNERAIREIIIQQSIYLAEIAIVPVTGITKDDKEEVKKSFPDHCTSQELKLQGSSRKKEGTYYLLLIRIKLTLNVKRIIYLVNIIKKRKTTLVPQKPQV